MYFGFQMGSLVHDLAPKVILGPQDGAFVHVLALENAF